MFVLVFICPLHVCVHYKLKQELSEFHTNLPIYYSFYLFVVMILVSSDLSY